MTLLNELIDIPENLQKGDFVLRLSEGVSHAEETVRNYVVTEQLARCFDQALAFVRAAVDTNSSKAAYLHGSFGSGKSHFMAVLHLLLSGDPHARGIKELAATVAKQKDWMKDKKFLLVPYHMIGSHDIESGILGGYVDYIQRKHSDAPLPAVYKAEGLFRDARNLRDAMKDEAFFEKLNEGAAGAGWGKLEKKWDGDSYENAVASPPESSERSRVIGALVKQFFKSYDTQAGGRGEAFLSLDKGLAVISKHAAELGYDGLILFLDELILWLASHAGDISFVQREGQKLVKLVEWQQAERSIPIISFVARQRDLRELIGDSIAGSERANFSSILAHHEGRFERINLEDRNLPAIVEKRILRAKNDAARKELDAAFEKTSGVRDAVFRILLTAEGDRKMFRQVYPFSPALITTLVAVSSLLQRERTALRVLMQLLVDQRDTLAVGDVVPVGDLFDVVAHGQEAFTADMAVHFDHAKRLYHQRLLPLIERTHNLTKEAADKLPFDDPKRQALVNDDRLVKTLLLSALVPEVETLRALTAERLAALNHGTIKSPIPGREGPLVLEKCRQWAQVAGQIHISEQANPTITVQLSGVDTEAILKQAENEDNHGNRVRLIRQMVFEALGVEGDKEFEQYKSFFWRNTERTCSILFQNIRELPLSLMANKTDAWKVVIDYPFDEGNHGPQDDRSKVEAFEKTGEQAKTLCWIPSFFGEEGNRDVGTLVRLEHILKGDQFANYALHLSEQDRGAAKAQLENQRAQLRSAVRAKLEVAYGISTDAGVLDSNKRLEPSEQFRSLFEGIDVKPPTSPTLVAALEEFLDQVLTQQHPAAPEFGAETKPHNLGRVFEVFSEACGTSDGRALVDLKYRSIVRGIANPLKLGELAADGTHFVISHHWKNHFSKRAVEDGGPLTVGKLLRWIDQPQSMGLPLEVCNLIIMCYAVQTNRMFRLHGGVVEQPSLRNLSEALELHEEALPDEANWAKAVALSESLFGITPLKVRNASNVARFEETVQRIVSEHRTGCNRLYKALSVALPRFGVERDSSERFRTAQAMLDLAEKIHVADKGGVVGALASADLPTSPISMSQVLMGGDEMASALEADWDSFDGARALGGEAEDSWEEVKQALTHDELAKPLAETVTHARQVISRVMLDAVKKAASEKVEEKEEGRRDQAGQKSGRLRDADVKQARKQIEALEKEAAGRQLRMDLEWRFEGPSAK